MAISIPEKLSSSSINILHISDIHFKNEKYFLNRDHIERNIFSTIQRHIIESSIYPDCLVITGDIAWSGKRSEYKLAMNFLQNLINLISINDIRVFIVPGNHDVNREIAQKDALRFSSKKYWNEFLEREHKAETVRIYDRMEEYYSFLSDINKYITNTLPTAKGEYFYTDEFQIKDCKYYITGLNSAWACCDDNDHANIALGFYQVFESTKKMPDQSETISVKIALMHHPFTCFHKDDLDTSYDQISESFDIVLRGHSHKGGSKGKIKDGVELHELSVGAGYLTKTVDEDIGFQFICVDPIEGKYYIWPYLWNGRYFYMPNEKSIHLSENGFIESSFRDAYHHLRGIEQTDDRLTGNKRIPPVDMIIRPSNTDIKTILKKVGITEMDLSMEEGTTVKDCIKKTDKSLSFLGVAAFKWIKEKKAMDEMLKRVILLNQPECIRFLLMNPNCPAAKKFLAIKKYDPDEYIANFNETLNFFEEKRKSMGKEFVKVRLYSSLPSWRIVNIDENRLIIGTYSLTSDTGTDQPQIIFKGTSKWSFAQNYIATFNEKWSNSLNAFE